MDIQKCDEQELVLRIIAHDISNSVSLLSNCTRILKKPKNLSLEKINNYYSIIDRSIESIKHCVDMSQRCLIANKRIVQTSPISTNDLIQNSIILNNEMIVSKNIKLETDIQDVTILGDLQNISLSILGNFLTNAIKFSNRSSTIKIGSYIANDTEVAIYVQDAGVGMSCEQIESVFKNDAHSTNGTENEKGYGLGAVIANNFLIKHNGRLEIKSNIDEGSSGTLVTAYFPKY
ncbi:hypothetical protein A9Q84_13810 [Halobacteriovorax marinus]|uniref:histidine kinase n=1 Tax=Halobacteriovorax marinus TaxID=97084 RepID=A0A1Y5F8Y4_9BACT|nr:hypothetical protein A9Q84_13810 [Halobacteriovorax marinus]